MLQFRILELYQTRKLALARAQIMSPQNTFVVIGRYPFFHLRPARGPKGLYVRQRHPVKRFIQHDFR